MAITVQQCSRHIEHTLGGDADPLVPVIELVNAAGEFLVSMTGWRWLTEGTATLDLVAGQDYVALPADFKAIRAVTGTDSSRLSVDLVTLAEVLEWRTYASGSGEVWKAALEASSPATGGAVTWRLAVAPSPVSASTAALTLYYERGWRTVSESQDQLSLPSYCETLYLEVLRAFARGREEEDVASLDQRLEALARGQILDAAKRADSTAQPHLGTLRGGYGHEAQSWNARHWRSGSDVTLA